MHHLRFRLRLSLTVAAIPCLLALGCGDVIGPIPLHRTVMVLSFETPVLTVVNGETGRVAGTIALADAVELGSLSADRSTLYLALGRSSLGDMLALDTHSFDVRWSEQQSTPLSPRYDRWNGVAVAAYGAIAPTSDGARLYVAPAWRRPDTGGVAMLDGATRNLVAFSGGPLDIELQGLVIIPPGPSAPLGMLLAAGARDQYAIPVVDWLFSLDPVTLAVTDSAPIVDIPSGSNRYLISPVVAPDGRSIYLIGLGTEGKVYKYDPVSRQVLASAPLQGSSSLALSPDGTTIYQTRGSPGPSTPAALVMYDAALNFLGSIDLPDINGLPPAVRALTTSPDGSRVYITAGTGSIVPLGGVTSNGHLIAVDPIARRVLWTVPLGIWAPGRVFVR